MGVLILWKGINMNTTTTIINYNDVIIEEADGYNIVARVWDIDGENVIFNCVKHQGYTTVNRNAEAITGDKNYNEAYMFASYGSPKVSAYSNHEGTYVDALLYAGVRGNAEAMSEFNALADTGKALAEEHLVLSDEYNLTKWDDIESDFIGPLNIDKLYLVHVTKYDVNELIDDEGNLIIRPSGDYKNMVEWANYGEGYFQRHSIHFTINHAVTTAKVAGITVGEWDEGTAIIVPLRAVLEANPGTLESLSANDTWFVPNVGEGLVIPAGKYHLIGACKSFSNEVDNYIATMKAERFYTKGDGNYSCEKSSRTLHVIRAMYQLKGKGLHMDNSESMVEKALFSDTYVNEQSRMAPTCFGFMNVNINTGARIFSTASWHGLGEVSKCSDLY